MTTTSTGPFSQGMMTDDQESSIEDKKKKLDTYYRKGKDSDKKEFALMRSSLLLIAGEHYSKGSSSRLWDRIRSTQQFTNEAKLRLTKNHIAKISYEYSNHIVGAAPGIAISPKFERDMRSRKSAELHQAVWNSAKEQMDFATKVQEWGDDFVGTGECWTKIVFDPSAGPVKGYEPQLDEFGQQMVDEMGQPMVDESKPVHVGELKIEEVLPFNVIGAEGSKNIEKSPWLCHEEMSDTKDIKKQFPEFADKISDSEDDTIMVFDAMNGYRQGGKGETLVKYWYFRKCAEYPQGYFFIQVSGHVVAEGELPAGIFPLIGKRFEAVQTRKRGFAITERLRPYQVEINRCASAIAEHQITIGADKLILQNGAKMSSGGKVPGIRSITVTGAAPTILPGRSGAQYMDYMVGQIKEMYEIANIFGEDDSANNLDPHTLLYRSASKKKKFKRYVLRFESFLREFCKTYLSLAKYYLDEDAIIMAVGQNERVNISEFKNDDFDCVDLKLEPQTEDIETRLGRQLSINHVLQYVSSQLGEDAIGMLIKQMPYANFDEDFSDFTLDYESSENDLLMLQRGQMPQPPVDRFDYHIKRITKRMKEPDFMYLQPEIQQLHDQYKQSLMQIKEQEAQAIARAQSGFIPDGGTRVRADFYIEDEEGKSKRAEFPTSALEWLHSKLTEQGAFVQDSQSVMSGQNAIDMSAMMGQQGAGAPGGAGAGAGADADQQLAAMLAAQGGQGVVA